MSFGEIQWLHTISDQLGVIITLLHKVNTNPVPVSGKAVHLDVIVGPITLQGEDHMQVHDNEQFTLSVSAVDSKGFPTSDTFTVSVDNPDVVSVVDDDQDGRTFLVVAGNPGSAVVTIQESDGPLFVTEAVDVVVGDAVTVSVVEGTPEDQPVPEQV